MRKLRYVDRVARQVGSQPPVLVNGVFDVTVEDMKLTVAEYYRRLMRQNGAAVNVALESDLRDMFIARGRRRKGLRPAWELLEPHRESLTAKITYWTGVKRPVVRALVERILRTLREHELNAIGDQEETYLIELTAYGTTLAMNYLTRGRFVQS